MSIEEVNAELNIKRTTAHHMRKAGTYPPVTYLRPGKPVVLRVNFESWLRNLAQQHQADNTEAA
ncbi:hypothetical protein D2917_11035 [Cupriavidus oxalaticus]|uniref:DNA-binding protein n=2 Tax=Cupriavidus oxalaticus TaxID=96344 RepID=A0A5P3VFQ3_9BURK|nr:hypothetical protein D2917_11035 [Cupriavidus oxalaticus]